MSAAMQPSYRRTSNLVDVLDRVLDKGLVVAGDIRVSLAEVELLTIRIRLIVCSIDKAEQIGLDWWRDEPRSLAEAEHRELTEEVGRLREQTRQLQRRLAALDEATEPGRGAQPTDSPTRGDTDHADG